MKRFHARGLQGYTRQPAEWSIFDPGEESLALRLGLGDALQKTIDGDVAQTRMLLNKKAGNLRQALGAIPGLRILDLGEHKAACVTFTLDGVACATVMERLAARGISIGMNGRAYTPYDLESRNIASLTLRQSCHLSSTCV